MSTTVRSSSSPLAVLTCSTTPVSKPRVPTRATASPDSAIQVDTVTGTYDLGNVERGQDSVYITRTEPLP